MDSLTSDTLKNSENNRPGISYDEHICFRATANFKEELEEIADYYNRDTSDILREAVIRLVRQEAKARYGGGESDDE